MRTRIAVWMTVVVFVILSCAACARAADRYEKAYETAFGRLGSRFYVNPQPQKLSWKQSPMGTFMEYEESFYAGVKSEGQVAALPFQRELPLMRNAMTAMQMTSGMYLAEHPAGLSVEMQITAPFWPRDEKLSGAPFFYIDVTVDNKTAERRTGTLFLGQTFERNFKIRKADIAGEKGLRVEGSYISTRENKMDVYIHPELYKKIKTTQALALVGPDKGAEWFPERFLASLVPGTTEKPGKRSAGVTLPFRLAPGGTVTYRFVLAAYVADNMLFGKEGKKYVFKYTNMFPDVDSVVDYAVKSQDEVAGMSLRFNMMVEEMSLQQSFKNFLAFAFQSWMLNTVWATGPGGEEWFSELEGDCQWHSTVDVSYNTAMLYYELWPELLRMQLEEWPRYLRDGKIILHDMGHALDITGTAYSMPVEENANYILMLHEYLVATGDAEFIKGKMELVKALVDFIIDCDKNGDGFPEEGNYNTFERKLPNPLGGKDVVYVAVKAYAGIRAAEELATWTKDREFAARCREFIKKFKATLDARAWAGDHYVICLQDTIAPGELKQRWSLPRSTFPAGQTVYDDTIPRDPATDSNAAAVPLKYHDAYTVLTSNGLLYLLRSATSLDTDDARIKEDLYNATVSTWREFGNPHTGDPDDKGAWLSENIWRDMTAAYLGWDWSDNFDAYWQGAAFTTKVDNEGVFSDSHFYDTDPVKGWDLRYYPRGATAFGEPSALAGISYDYATKTMKIRRVRKDLHIPLFRFADWKHDGVPWLTVSVKDGVSAVDVTDKQLLGDWKTETDTSLITK